MSIFKSIVNRNLSKDILSRDILSQIILQKNKFYFSNTSLTQLKNYCNNKKTLTVNDIKTLWKSILTDSISFLKINDSREKLFLSSKETLTVNKNDDKEFRKNFNKISKISSFGIDELDRYFDEFVDFEKVLYGAVDSYRDHVDHVIQVWSLGLAFIDLLPEMALSDGVVNSNDIFSFEFKNSENNLFLTKGEIHAIWSIIALCHDLGYPIEKASKINKKLKRIISHFGSLNISEFEYSFGNVNNSLIEKFLSLVSSKPIVTEKDDLNCYGLTAIQSKYHDKLSKSFEDYKHGSFSALLIFKTLTFFLETDITYPNNNKLTFEDTRQFYIRREILRAICGHTCPKLYHIYLNTLSFILIFCDELHEYGRPKFEDMRMSFSSSKDYASVKVLCFNFTKARDKIKGKIHAEIKYKIEEYNDIVGDLVRYKNYATLKKNCKYFERCDDFVKSKFKMFHHLLRSAKDDSDRTFVFKWDIIFNNKIKYCFSFDSDKSAFDIVETKILKKQKQSFLKWDDVEIYD